MSKHPGEIVAARVMRTASQRRRDALHEARKRAARAEFRSIIRAWLAEHGHRAQG